MNDKIYPEVVEVEEVPDASDLDNYSNYISWTSAPLPDDDTSKASWAVFLSPYPTLTKFAENATRNELQLSAFICRDIDLCVVDSWLKEAEIPLKERNQIVCLVHQYRNYWNLHTCGKTSESAQSFPNWIKCVHKQTQPPTAVVNIFPDKYRSQKFKQQPSGSGKAKNTPCVMKEDVTSLSIAAFIPFVNIIYDFFFDETPTLDAMKETLNLLGVMGTLIFTIVVTIPLSYDYDAYESMLERWSDSGAYANCWVGGFSELNYFINMTSISIAFAFITVVLVLFVYVVLVNSSFNSPEELTVWWLYTRWLYGFIFATLTLSCVTSFFALGNIIEWSVPNEHVLRSATNDCPLSLKTSPGNPMGFRNVFTNWICGVSLCSAGLILSMAIRGKAFVRVKR
jgi:hypothetical protein